MAPSTTPLTVARFAVGLSVRALPGRSDQERYRAEFLAELHDLTPAAQLRYAAGVLSQTFALRAALGSSSARIEGAAMRSTIPRGRRFRCRALHWHHWRLVFTDGGSRGLFCSVRGKEDVSGQAPWLPGG